MGWCSLDAEGASEGILLQWDSRVLEMVELCMGSYSVLVIFWNVKDDVKWMFSGVYGSNVNGSRRVLWDESVGVFS